MKGLDRVASNGSDEKQRWDMKQILNAGVHVGIGHVGRPASLSCVPKCGTMGSNPRRHQKAHT
ncbi:hypothetical protein MJO28_007427 [Puccinia striiformis f. sp. tritici]|uniref:Uncharacterized protein n=1 Tax=Puccinia striiformis f. sp. tritici TaxID=168172 RepID=A0ACC0EG20_9BASI|nr:hypothetical protein MJO28_007427 [Puccinia striiformis f. sp. tritici]